ncbi:HPr family phosphocarrier protein [uncultured Oscillibacter sp.]|uniref:HPr family phosphocarrier protein n=1 Tax=uncultured Oscillibacter sp. TaxID=876091 RepID=UPI0025F1C5DF|nr:HPr family phosphocarrier protein [uncultured Oscillibacter sp.]
MKEFSYTVQDHMGIHARPAGQIVKLAKGLSSRIVISKGEKSADARRLIALMGLNVLQGETVSVSVEGEREDEDFQTMQRFFEENL